MSNRGNSSSGRRQGPRRGGPTRGGPRGTFSPRGGHGIPSDTTSTGGSEGHFRGHRGFRGPPYTRRGPSSNREARPGGTIFMPDRPSAVDARIKDDSDKAVVARLDSSGSDVSAGPNGLPLRPDFGTQGREILLRANFFPVDVQGKIFRYAAAIALSDGKVTRGAKRRVFDLAAQSEDWQQAGMVGRVAHDGAERLVASILLPQPLVILGAYHSEGEDPPAEGGIGYTLTLTFEEEVDQALLKECLAGNPVDSQALQKVLSALNLVLSAPTSHTRVKIGRDDDDKKHPDQRLFFDTPTPKDIRGGLTAREGFYLSVRPTHRQLMVNVNTCHAAFYKPQNFVDAMDEYLQFVEDGRPRGGSGRGRGGMSGRGVRFRKEYLGAFGTHVRVKTRHTGKIVMIEGISEESAHQHTMSGSPFGKVTIAEYYKRKYSTLQYPDLPLLKGPGDSLYPPELCDIIPDQGFKGELTSGKHATEMLNVACNPPKKNAEEIVNRGLDLLGFQNPNTLLESFGISVGTEMAVVPGRVLDKPGLAYSSDAPATIDDRASWNLRNVKFAVGARLDKWAVLEIRFGGWAGFGDDELRSIMSEFHSMCNKCGMRVRPLGEQACAAVQLPRPDDKSRFREDALEEIEKALVSLMGRTAPELVLVLLPNDDKNIYNGLKRLCDVKLDIATVCMQSEKVRKDRGRQQYFANVALKVNMKLGGINHTLDANSGAWLKSASTMVMGMDVTHPGTKSNAPDGPPSIVAVVASVDEHFAQYPAKLAIRRSGVEIERSDNVVKDMFVSRFELYRDHNNGNLPKRVILFRDGVSESQFAQVREYELKQMKKAFEHFGSYRPKLSIIICGKRHHTRFYPTKEEDAAHDGNPLPGTVVDRGVTLAYEFDFFLQAHGGLKGTTRPTHYFVVHDENEFNADDLQRVTNDLSYMFARATKAVSLVSPAYWADVACERGRCYLHNFLMGPKDGGADTKGKSKGKEKGKDKRGQKGTEESMYEKAVKVWGDGVSGPRLRDTMFYL